MIRRNLFLAAVIVAATLMMTGCGGGGSSGPTYDLDAIATKYAETKHAHTLYAAEGNDVLMADIGQVPGPAATVCDTSAKTTAVTIQFFDNQTPTSRNAYIRSYHVGPYSLVCDYDTISGFVTVYSNSVALPSAASIGDSGSLDTATTYYDTSLKTVAATATDTWALQSDDKGNAVFCANTVSESNGQSESESDCYTLDTSGEVTSLTISITFAGKTVTYQPLL